MRKLASVLSLLSFGWIFMGCPASIMKDSLDLCTASYGETTDKKEACDRGALLVKLESQKAKFDTSTDALKKFMKSASEEELVQLKAQVYQWAALAKKRCKEDEKVTKKWEGTIPELLSACEIGVSYFRSGLVKELNAKIKEKHGEHAYDVEQPYGSCWGLK